MTEFQEWANKIGEVHQRITAEYRQTKELRNMEPSCAKCFHASWDVTEDWESFDNRKEYEIVCNHPSMGDLSRVASERQEIINNFHDATVDDAVNCESYTYFLNQI